MNENKLKSMKKLEVSSNEYDEYYGRYIHKLSDDITLIDSFSEGALKTYDFFKNIANAKLDYKYQPEKWSIKEIFQHLIDSERVFMHRCFRIARRDTTPLAGFDQNIYISPSNASHKSIGYLLEEFKITRANSIQLLKSLDNEDLSFIGNANGTKMSARAAAFVIPGHDIWHIEIIKERYL